MLRACQIWWKFVNKFKHLAYIFVDTAYLTGRRICLNARDLIGSQFEIHRDAISETVMNRKISMQG